MKRELSVDKNCKNSESVLNELKLGYINLEDGLFKLAETNFDMVILADPTCADAYFGLMLCKYKIRREEALKSNATLYKDIVKLKEYEKALEYADETKKAIYKNLLSEVLKLHEGDNY